MRSQAWAATSRSLSALLPDVPALAESGLPDYEMPAWRSIMGPAGMPCEIVDILNRTMVAALASRDLREKLAGTGSLAQSSTPEELRKRYLDGSAIFGRIAREAGLKPQEGKSDGPIEKTLVGAAFRGTTRGVPTMSRISAMQACRIGRPPYVRSRTDSSAFSGDDCGMVRAVPDPLNHRGPVPFPVHV